ncbi:MAG: acyl-CoA dehydrogenase family protein [Deltaproteobacteria bacterium]|nr:acyl-CoA dehydrogenase family protein [Deltaproteobacteria bacterium]MBI3387680.1 acyl-CoA dehydrogenase family protein [Deltaproteobacteria bacterium]
MDLRLTEQHLKFRDELRAWLTANLARPWREELRDPNNNEDSLMEVRRQWQRKLHAAGYVGMDWPTEWGGRGASEVEKSVFEEESARADAPQIVNFLGIGLLGPALIHHGSEAQRRRFIPPMLAADEIWCQGFSEPGAGSDLAALRTSATLDGDHFVINGQKIWTTFGPWADWIFVLARTDSGDRYGGISFILCKLDTPGIIVRRLRQITGESEFGEVFFEDARVPRENLVGQIGEGWRIAMTVLAYERGAMSLAYAARFERDIRQLAIACREHGRGGTAVREKLGRLFVENEVMRANGLRNLANFADGNKPGPESSFEKIFWSEFDKRFRDVALDLLGPGGLLERSSAEARADVDWAREFLWARAGTIYSGSSEIQRNIISKRVLNLPQI